MKSLKTLGLVMVMALALGLGAGCSKKTEMQTSTSTEDPAAALNAAVQTITDGIVYFDYDKYDVKSEYTGMLQQKAELMKAYPDIRVRIEGNCDERGTQEYNLALGERRARAVYDYMVMLGVNPDQLEMISYGKERPRKGGGLPAVCRLCRSKAARLGQRHQHGSAAERWEKIG